MTCEVTIGLRQHTGVADISLFGYAVQRATHLIVAFRPKCLFFERNIVDYAVSH